MAITFSTAPPPLVRASEPSRAREHAVDATTQDHDQIVQVQMPSVSLAGDQATIKTQPVARNARSLRDQIEAAESAWDRGASEDTWDLVQSAETLAPEDDQYPEQGELLGRIERLYEKLLGGTNRRVRAISDHAAQGAVLTPGQAFLLSRMTPGSTIDDVVDLSHLRRRDTLSNSWRCAAPVT